MITIMEGLAQEEANSISRNVRWSLRRRMADGTLKIARVPYGYAKDEKRNLVIDEEKAAVVRRIYELYLSGLGVRKIAVIFNEEHIPSPTGKLWNNITVKKILKQEKYMGDIRWQKTYSIFMGEHWKINHGEADSFYIENAHPAIIDRETFYLAQQIREEAAEKAKPKSETKKELFQGKIKCTCGRSYYRVKAKTDYWQCIGRCDLVNPCKNHIFYTHEIETAWNRFCTKLRMHADEILTSVLVQLEMMENAVKGTEIDNLQSQADEIRQRRYMLCKLCAENCIDREKFLTAENELDAELKAVTVQIEKVSNFADDTAEQVETVCKAISTMPPERLVNTILDHAVVDGKNITFYLIGGLYFREEL